MKRIIAGFVLFFLSISPLPVFATDGFTQKDRELLIELRLKMEQIDRRFEQIDRRFEQVDVRFSELREDMNNRFKQVDNRFSEMLTFLGILAGVFGGMVVAIFSFAYWDRRTILAKAREEVRKITEADRNILIDNRHLLEKLLEALRQWAKKSPDLKEILQQLNLL